MTPLSVKNKITEQTMAVPCGRCPNCYARRVSAWSFRLMQHLKVSESAHFITLTYDTTHVPITKKGYMVLQPKDLQLFFKRLRKSHGISNIKYYAVGEYGGKSNRPHYHIILYNAKLELIQPAWQLGQVHYGDKRGVTEASIGYCLKYMSKTSKIPLHANDDRIPQFGRQSKGLGLNYITAAARAWHLADEYNRMYINLTDGKKIAMPRYYKEKIYEEAQRKRIGAVTLQRMQKEDNKIFIQNDPKKPLKNPLHFRNQAEAVKAAFIKMEKDATRNQKI